MKNIDTNSQFFLKRKAQPDVIDRTDDAIMRIIYHELRGHVKALDNTLEMLTPP